MSDAIRRAFETMARTRKLTGIYRKWFTEPTPTGELVNLPISVQLAETFHSLGAEDF